MPSRDKVSGVNRAVAVLLALVWLCAGIAGMYFGVASGQWLLVVVAFAAVGYSLLWARVAVRARLLSWRELVAPWRSH